MEVSLKNGGKLVEKMRWLEGARQWDTAVGMIQRWFYGSYVHAPWCATTVSYAAHMAGLTFPKEENVYTLLLACADLSRRGTGDFFYYDGTQQLRSGDVLFWLWKGEVMGAASSKHVGVCTELTPAEAETIPCIGGNQSKMVCTKQYPANRLYAVYRP